MDILLDETVESLEKRALDMPISGSLHSFDIPDPKSVTYTDYDDPFSFVHDTSGAPHISKMSQNAWVGCGDDIYVLECLGKGFIRIDPVKTTLGGY